MSNGLNYYNHHPPDEVRLFKIPARSIRLWNSQSLVYDVQYGAMVLRHYAFYDKWFEVNCTLGLDGNFVTEKGSIEWCFNCDICTPQFSIENNVFDIDLFIDVLVNPNGKEHVMTGEDDFLQAEKKGWITYEEQKGAEHGLRELLEIINSDGLIIFLEKICPFEQIKESDKGEPYKIRKLSEFPYLYKENRFQYLGKKI